MSKRPTDYALELVELLRQRDECKTRIQNCYNLKTLPLLRKRYEDIKEKIQTTRKSIRNGR